MKTKTLTNSKLDKFLHFISQAFAGELSFQNDETAFACGLAALDSFTEEWENNVLNQSRKSKLPYLKGLFFKLEQFGRFMPRGNREIEDLRAFKGLNFLLDKLAGNTPLDELANELSADFVADIRLYRLRVLLATGSVDGFATFDALDLCAHQQLLAAQLVTLAWLTLTAAYTTLGGIASAPPEKSHKRLVIKTPILEDLRSFMPGMREMTADSHPNEEDVYIEFGRHLTSIRWWNYPYAGSWQAPVEYEQAFHDAPDKAAFLAGFRRLLKAIEPILNLPYNDNPLFKEDNGCLLAENREKQRWQSIHRARVNHKRMHQWLQAREKPATTQLLEAVEYVALIPEWDDEAGSPTNTLTVADYLPEDELTLRFEMLLRRFQNEIPTTHLELNSLCDRLSRLISYPTTVIAPADFKLGGNTLKIADLVRLVPQFALFDRTSEVSKQPIFYLASDFRTKLEAVITARLPWAQRALALVNAVLPAAIRAATPVRIEKKPALSIAQIALLYAYKNEGEELASHAAEILDEHGHTSIERLMKFFNSYNNSKNRINPIKRTSRRVIADIEAIMLHLNDFEQQTARYELDILRSKN